MKAHAHPMVSIAQKIRDAMVDCLEERDGRYYATEEGCKGLRGILDMHDIQATVAVGHDGRFEIHTPQPDAAEAGPTVVKLHGLDSGISALRSEPDDGPLCSCGHHNRYHFADGHGYIRCRATRSCRCGWRVHEDAAVDPDAVPPTPTPRGAVEEEPPRDPPGSFRDAK